jgi:ElaB/YqjD/DUF883 family membrane-anchored ribosome-binding protein
MDMESNVKDPVSRAANSSQTPSAAQPATQHKGNPILGAAQKTATPTANELHHFLSDIEDLVRQATSLTGDELTQVKATISARLASARASAEQMGGNIVTRARQSATATNEYVHHRPWTAIGAGAAAGLLVGFLLSRRAH